MRLVIELMKLVFYQISQFPTSFSLYLTEFQIFPVKPHVNNSYMNRRVEFSLATPSDIEMDPPETLNSSPSNTDYGY
jgi:hypothetical protein